MHVFIPSKTTAKVKHGIKVPVEKASGTLVNIYGYSFSYTECQKHQVQHNIIVGLISKNLKQRSIFFGIACVH